MRGHAVLGRVRRHEHRLMDAWQPRAHVPSRRQHGRRQVGGQLLPRAYHEVVALRHLVHALAGDSAGDIYGGLRERDAQLQRLRIADADAVGRPYYDIPLPDDKLSG